MTKFSKWLGGAALAAALGIMAFGATGIYGATEVEAQSPPPPAARFTGTVTIDGEPASAGTSIEARVGDTSCGNAAVQILGGQASYVIDVAAHGPGASGCGSYDEESGGSAVTFIVGGQVAQQTGEWINHQLNQLNLTVVSPTATPTATPTEEPTDEPTTGPGTATATPDDDATSTPDDGDDNGNGGAATATPGAPDTGSAGAAGTSSAMWLFAALGLGAAAFGAAGTVAVRRNK